MKTCTKCGESKPLNEYWDHPGTKDRKGSRCKSCINEDNRLRYAAKKAAAEKAEAEAEKLTHDSTVLTISVGDEVYRFPYVGPSARASY